MADTIADCVRFLHDIILPGMQIIAIQKFSASALFTSLMASEALSDITDSLLHMHQMKTLLKTYSFSVCMCGDLSQLGTVPVVGEKENYNIPVCVVTPLHEWATGFYPQLSARQQYIYIYI